MKKLRSTGSAVCTSPANPYCHATTVTFNGNLLRGGIRVNTNLFPSISAGLLSRSNIRVTRNRKLHVKR